MTDMHKNDTMAAYVADRHPELAPFDWFGRNTVRPALRIVGGVR